MHQVNALPVIDFSPSVVLFNSSAFLEYFSLSRASKDNRKPHERSKVVQCIVATTIVCVHAD
jgi:hypothetical protein